MTESITLYGFGDQDRSGKVRWLAAELGLEVREERVTAGEHRKRPYTEKNPLEQIPTVIFRGETYIESTAICHVLAESFDSPKLWVGRGEPNRAKYVFWLGAFGENLEGRLVECAVSKLGILPPEVFATHEKRVRHKLELVTSLLPREGFLAGDAFTIADIVAGYSLRLAVGLGLVAREAIEPYYGRLVSRDAARAARFFPKV